MNGPLVCYLEKLAYKHHVIHPCIYNTLCIQKYFINSKALHKSYPLHYHYPHHHHHQHHHHHHHFLLPRNENHISRVSKCASQYSTNSMVTSRPNGSSRTYFGINVRASCWPAWGVSLYHCIHQSILFYITENCIGEWCFCYHSPGHLDTKKRQC